jgi:hypothetical protein
MQVKFKVPNLTCQDCSCGHCAQMLLIGFKCHKDIISVKSNFKEKIIEIDFVKPMTVRRLMIFAKNKGYEMEEIEAL